VSKSEVMAGDSTSQLRDAVVSLAHRNYDVREFSLGAARIMRRAVGFDGVCVLTLDPATLLPTGEVVENGLPPAATERMAEIEVGPTDFNKFAALAQATSNTARLSQATGGELNRSLRHREVRGPHGLGDELRAALVSDSTTWGAMTLLRGDDSPAFTADDAAVVSALSAQIAEGLRRATVRAALVGPGDHNGAPGLVVLQGNEIALTNSVADALLGELLDGAPSGAKIPPVVGSVAGKAQATASGADLTDARARVRTSAGRWLLVHGSTVGDGPETRTVVVLEQARTPELAPLIAAAYGFTERERLVTELVAQGLDTNAIGQRLYISPWTVQDHLKAVFEKTGVSTRGELVARIFFEHYAPRLGDLAREAPPHTS
jgi:DNA-binding CsgD family transcriptional regulator